MTGMQSMVLQDLVNGLSAGLGYALVAIGFTLIFGVLNAVNFAHGEIYMLGGFVGLIVARAFSVPFFVVIMLVAATGAILGAALEFIAFRPMRRNKDDASLKSRSLREATLLSSLAVGIIIRELMEIGYGGYMQQIPDGLLINRVVTTYPAIITNGDLIILAIAAVMLGSLLYVLRCTRIGLGIRAVSDDLLGALYSGLNTDRVIVTTFAIGSAFGAVAGALIGLYYGVVEPFMGFSPMLKAFVAMLMGGMTNIAGAVLCAVVIGLCESFGAEVISSRWVEAIPYILLLTTLLFFPSGLFGKRVDRA